MTPTANGHPTLHVLSRREDIEPDRLIGRVVVVIDVLFATSTIVRVLAAGAASIYPACDEADARAAAGERKGALLAGEYLAHTLPDWLPPTPLALAKRVAGHGGDVVYCTTNGTRAIAASKGATAVYAGALTNAAALSRHIVQAHPASTVLLVCAGSLGRFCLEDFIGAGRLVQALRAAGTYAPTDAALAAELACAGGGIAQSVAASRVGRVLARNGLSDEIVDAADCDSSDVVPVLRDGVLVRATP